MLLKGLTFNNKTPLLVAKIIAEHARTGKRLRFWFGDIETGRSWEEEWDTVGHIGVSGGPQKVPLLMHQSNSHCGPAILTDCVIKIVDTKTKRTLYVHPLFHQPRYKIVKSEEPGYVSAVTANGVVVANFKTVDKAQRFVAFMDGTTMSKGGRS